MFLFILKTGLIAVFMLCNNAVLGMYCSPKSIVLAREQKSTENKNKQSIIPMPMELIVATAACSSDETKDVLQKTCKELNTIISPYNPHFIVHHLFAASAKTMNRIALRYSWYNNDVVIKSLKKNLGSSIVIPSYTRCCASGTSVKGFDKKFAIELPGQCNTKYNIVENYPYTSNPPIAIVGDNTDDFYANDLVATVADRDGKICVMKKSEVDLAMYCAVVCDDTEAINNLVSKIDILYKDIHVYGKLLVYRDLMIILIKRKNKEAFEYMVKEDPYNIRKNKNLFAVVQAGEYTLLDYIDFEKDISSEEKQEYAALCRQYGEKTSKETSGSSNCIIS